jgi:hypothetical protein
MAKKRPQIDWGALNTHFTVTQRFRLGMEEEVRIKAIKLDQNPGGKGEQSHD